MSSRFWNWCAFNSVLYRFVTSRSQHQYLGVEQEADQAITQLLRVSAGHPLDCWPPCWTLSQLGLQQPLPLSPEGKSWGQGPEGLLWLLQLQLQPAVHQHPRTVSIGVHRVRYQQQSLMIRLISRKKYIFYIMCESDDSPNIAWMSFE